MYCRVPSVRADEKYLKITLRVDNLYIEYSPQILKMKEQPFDSQTLSVQIHLGLVHNSHRNKRLNSVAAVLNISSPLFTFWLPNAPLFHAAVSRSTNKNDYRVHFSCASAPPHTFAVYQRSSLIFTTTSTSNRQTPT